MKKPFYMSPIQAEPSIAVYECPPKSTKSIKTTYELHPSMFQKSKVKSKKPSSDEPYLLIGFDTEYETPNEALSASDVKEGLAKNTILSYQFSCLMSSGERWEGIACPEEGERYSFSEFIVFSLASGIAKDVISTIPNKIYLISHFARADLTAFSDFKELSKRISNVRNTFITINAPVTLRLNFPENPKHLNITFRDTMLLTPGGSGSKSLETVGSLVGIQKMKLSLDREEDKRLKQNLRIVRDEDWNRFKEYALTDARICAEYARTVISTTETITGKRRLPSTLSSIGVDLVLDSWRKKGFSADAMLGLEEVTETKWNESLNRSMKVKRKVQIACCEWRDGLISETYQGGRNEQYWFGPAYEADWSDYDLSSAYPTAMSLIGVPGWSEMFPCRDVEKFTATTLGFAEVDFEFPPHVRYPTLPVRTSNGLVFPLTGTSYCAAPEIAVAVRLGAKLTIKEGWIVPTDPERCVFGDFIKHGIAERAKHPKGSLQGLFWKELVNSTYGKTAQGLRPKRVYDLRDEDGRQLQRSRITNASYASFTTSFVRAVLGEIMNSIPSHRMIFSCTTDGFITDTTEIEMEAATAGPLCGIYRQARQALSGAPSLLEIKHKVRVPLGWTTRGQATLKPGTNGSEDASYNLVLAKGGISVPSEYLQTGIDNDYIVNLFMNRRPDLVLPVDHFTGIRDMVEHDADLVLKRDHKRLNMEYDWKRKPFAMGTHPVYGHIVFSTVPWRSLEDFTHVRELWDLFRSDESTCLKCPDDFQRFATYANSRLALQSAGVEGVRVRKEEPDLGLLRNNLCSAWRQSQAGLQWRRGQAATFAQHLSEAGLSSKRTDVEYGKERSFRARSCAPTEKCLAIVDRLRQVYPALDPGALFIPADDLTSVAVQSAEKCPFVSRVVATPAEPSKWSVSPRHWSRRITSFEGDGAM